MRVITALAFGLISVLLVVPEVDAQQQQSFVYGQVFEDLNADGSFDTSTELVAPNWTISLYDDSLALLGQAASSGTGLTEIIGQATPAYVCLEPQTDWLLTTPVGSAVTTPGSDWSCHEYDTLDVELQYVFGVNLPETDPEDIGTVVDDTSNQPSTQPESTDQPAVLGETTDNQALLAETGLPAVWAPLIGLGLMITTLYTLKKS